MEKCEMLVFRKRKRGVEIVRGPQMKKETYEALANFIINSIISTPDGEIALDVLLSKAQTQPFSLHGNIRELLQVKQDLEARDVIKTTFQLKCNQMILLNKRHLVNFYRRTEFTQI